MKLRDVTKETLRDVSVKQCYEWVRTGAWGKLNYTNWLAAKGVNSERDIYFGSTLIHTANAQLSYEWIKTGRWNLRLFVNWLNRKFFWEL